LDNIVQRVSIERPMVFLLVFSLLGGYWAPQRRASAHSLIRCDGLHGVGHDLTAICALLEHGQINRAQLTRSGSSI